MVVVWILKYMEKNDDNRTFIQIPNTRFWMMGEKKSNNKWDLYILDPLEGRKEEFKKNVSSGMFSLFVNTVLKNPVSVR